MVAVMMWIRPLRNDDDNEDDGGGGQHKFNIVMGSHGSSDHA